MRGANGLGLPVLRHRGGFRVSLSVSQVTETAKRLPAMQSCVAVDEPHEHRRQELHAGVVDRRLRHDLPLVHQRHVEPFRRRDDTGQ